MKTLFHITLLLTCAVLASAAEERVCPPPPEFPESGLERHSAGKAWFRCAEGYEPHGGSRVILCSAGVWSNLTLMCRKKLCGSAGELTNGYFNYEGEPVMGDKAYAICNDGYTLHGPKFIECGSAGWPSELPTCEEGEVEVLVLCSAPKVANSESKDFAHEYRVGDVVTVRCSPGFMMKRALQITCGSDGQWQPPPPQCERRPNNASSCGVPENTEGTNTRLAPKFGALRSFPSGAKVYYTCAVGYRPSRGSKYRRCIKGQWSRLELQCQKKTCGSAGELLNGHYEYSGTEFGDVATAVCDEGHQLVGHGTRNCLSRGWDGHEPVCEVLYCPEPPEVVNAELVGYPAEEYQYRSVVTYRCLVGATIGSTKIWCTEDGTWSTPLPQCKDVTCAPPKIPNASWVSSWRDRYQLRDSIYIQCNPRFSIIGPSRITCDETGQWSPALPKCRQTGGRRAS